MYSSFRDGRINNKGKMIELRTKTNCALIFIIESEVITDMDKLVDRRFPYRNIQSAIFHMMVRDNIHCMFSNNTAGTATLLTEFVKSMDSLVNKETLDGLSSHMITNNFDNLTIESDNGKINVLPGENLEKEKVVEGGEEIDNTEKVGSEEVEKKVAEKKVAEKMHVNAMELLTDNHEKSDLDCARELWCCFRGVASTSAELFISKWSVAEIINQTVTKEAIATCKYYNGKTLPKRVATSLTTIDEPTETKLLAAIPGISVATSKSILANLPYPSGQKLRGLLSWDVDSISMMSVGKANKKLGKKKAESIVRIFNYKL